VHLPEGARVTGASRPFFITGTTVYLYTSLYINMTQEELRLGTYVEVYARNIVLTYT
jgi:hypothetical protein